MDVARQFDSIDVDLKLNKRKWNAKTYQAIVRCMLENRVVLRENPGAFVRCNDAADGGFEIWIEK